MQLTLSARVVVPGRHVCLAPAFPDAESSITEQWRGGVGVYGALEPIANHWSVSPRPIYVQWPRHLRWWAYSWPGAQRSNTGTYYPSLHRTGRLFDPNEGPGFVR